MKTSIASRIKNFARKHKIITTIIVIVIIVGGYYWYHTATSASATPQYVLSSIRTGSIIQTVAGTGQVSASNQTDVLSQVSGTIQSINVSVGQAVHTGDLIATIDPTNAALSLENSKISFAKLTEPAKATDISNSLNNLTKSYNDGFSSASSIYLDMPAVISGMKTLFYSDKTSFLSDQNSASLSPANLAMRAKAGAEYDAAVIQYQNSLNEFKNLTRSSATSSLDAALANTYTTITMIAKAVADTQNTITTITNNQPDYQTRSATTATANINSWANQANSDLSSLSSAQNSIQSAKNSYTTLITGADPYDIQSAKISLQQQEKTYSNYFIRAPYDGVIGRIPVSIYNQAGNGTAIATIVGTQMTASISLDEISAAKIQVGQPATITFNAISGLTATGTVSVVDQIGTVTQGVVSYGVKIVINTQDDRIKPGMSINTSIVTYEKDGVLVVPTSAIKTQGGTSYVQTFDQTTVSAAISSTATASSTRIRTASSSQMYSGFASSTRQFSVARTLTISTITQPQQAVVVTGDSDDTNTEIVSGLTRGQFVVTKTITSGTAQTTTAPSLLSSLGGGRGGAAGGGAARITGGGAGRPGN